MEVEEFLEITEEGEDIRVRGQFVVDAGSTQNTKNRRIGKALTNAKAGESVMVQLD